MNIQVGTVSVSDYVQATINLDEWRLEYQHPTQSSVGGISSLPWHLLRRSALITSVTIVGTIPLPAEDVDLTFNGGIEVSFVFPSSPEIITKDDYSRIREE